MIYMYSKRNKYFVLLIIQIDKIHFIDFMNSIIFPFHIVLFTKPINGNIIKEDIINDKRSKNKEKYNIGKQTS